MKKVITSLFLLGALFLGAQQANAQTRPSLADLQREMADMQRRLMQDMQRAFDNIDTPQEGGSSYYFHFDTAIIGDGSGSSFFHFSPFGSDSIMQGGFGNMDKMLQEFFGFSPSAPSTSPESRFDDGNRSDAELLPEERLREEEPSGSSINPPKKTPPPAATKEPAKPVIKTIRI